MSVNYRKVTNDLADAITELSCVQRSRSRSSETRRTVDVVHALPSELEHGAGGASAAAAEHGATSDKTAPAIATLLPADGGAQGGASEQATLDALRVKVCLKGTRMSGAKAPELTIALTFGTTIDALQAYIKRYMGMRGIIRFELDHANIIDSSGKRKKSLVTLPNYFRGDETLSSIYAARGLVPSSNDTVPFLFKESRLPPPPRPR
jgi:hypothetical protein